MPAPPKAEKKIIKKVRFHDDDHIASGEKRRTRQEASPKHVPLRREDVQPLAGRKRMRPVIDEDDEEFFDDQIMPPQKQRRLNNDERLLLEDGDDESVVIEVDHVPSNGSVGQPFAKAQNKIGQAVMQS